MEELVFIEIFFINFRNLVIKQHNIVQVVTKEFASIIKANYLKWIQENDPMACRLHKNIHLITN